MNYGSRTSSWNPWSWVRFDLILPMKDLHINSNLNPLTKFTGSSRSIEFKDILPWNIPQETIQHNMRIFIMYAMKLCIPFWACWKVNGNWENNMIRISQWKESHCRTDTSIRKNKSKRARLWELVRDPSRNVNNLSKVIWHRKIITEFTRFISSTRIG